MSVMFVRLYRLYDIYVTSKFFVPLKVLNLLFRNYFRQSYKKNIKLITYEQNKLHSLSSRIEWNSANGFKKNRPK